MDRRHSGFGAYDIIGDVSDNLCIGDHCDPPGSPPYCTYPRVGEQEVKCRSWGRQIIAGVSGISYGVNSIDPPRARSRERLQPHELGQGNQICEVLYLQKQRVLVNSSDCNREGWTAISAVIRSRLLPNLLLLLNN